MTFANDNQRANTPQQRFATKEGRDRMLNIGQVGSMLGLSRATIYRLQQSGDFPERIMLTSVAARYSERSIAAWIEGKMKT